MAQGVAQGMPQCMTQGMTHLACGWIPINRTLSYSFGARRFTTQSHRHRRRSHARQYVGSSRLPTIPQYGSMKRWPRTRTLSWGTPTAHVTMGCENLIFKLGMAAGKWSQQDTRVRCNGNDYAMNNRFHEGNSCTQSATSSIHIYAQFAK